MDKRFNLYSKATCIEELLKQEGCETPAKMKAAIEAHEERDNAVCRYCKATGWTEHTSSFGYCHDCNKDLLSHFYLLSED